jgi:hypothetical protein
MARQLPTAGPASAGGRGFAPAPNPPQVAGRAPAPTARPPRAPRAVGLQGDYDRAAFAAEAEFQQLELAAGVALEHALAQAQANGYRAHRDDIDRARRAVARLQRLRRERGDLFGTNVAPAARTRNALRLARQARLLQRTAYGPAVSVRPRGPAQPGVPVFARHLAQRLDRVEMTSLWPPDPSRAERLALRTTAPPWANLPPPRLYDPDLMGEFRADRLHEVFTHFERDVVFMLPDVALRYQADFGRGPLLFGVPATDDTLEVTLVDAITALVMSTYEDVRNLFPTRDDFGVMFRVRGRIFNHDYTAAVHGGGESTVISMPPEELGAYYRAARQSGAPVRSSQAALRNFLEQAGAFQGIVARVQGLREKLEGNADGSDSHFLAEGLEMLMFPLYGPGQPAGACARRTKRRVTKHGMLLMDVASTQGNCFLAHILPLIGTPYTVKAARVARVQFGLPPAPAPITVELARSWALVAGVHLVIVGPAKQTLLDTSTALDMSVQRPFIRLLLDKGHYSHVHSMESGVKHKCERCGTAWKWGHNCNSYKVNFFRRKVQDRPVVPRVSIKEDELDPDSVMFFDIETLLDAVARRLEAYAVGYAIGRGPFQYVWGRQAMSEFVAILVKAVPKYLVAFNGRSFDFLILVRALGDAGVPMSKLVFDGGKLMSGVVNNTTRLWDLFNFVRSSLRKAAESFKIESRKGSFPHRFVSWDTLDYDGDWPENAIDYFFERDQPEARKYLASKECPKRFNLKAECLAYLKSDVRCLQEIFFLTNQSYRDRFETNATKFQTGPQAAFEIMLAHLPDEVELEIPRDPQLASFLEDAYFGGVTQCYRLHARSNTPHTAGYDPSKPETRNTVLDVNGLYPYEMAEQPMPEGLSRWMTQEELQSPPRDKCFVIEFSYEPPRNLFVPVLPTRDGKEGVLRYTVEPGRGKHPSMKFWLAVELGYRITAVHRGRIWDKSSRYMRPIMLLHQEQRRQAKAAGNDAMSITAKANANDTYGKCAQSPRNRVVEAVRSAGEMRDFIGKNRWIDFCAAGGNLLFMIGEKPLPPNDSGYKKPLATGLFITGYAQEHLFRLMMIISPGLRDPHAPIYYCDTDSITTNSDGAARLKQAGWIGKEPGQMDNDLIKDKSPAELATIEDAWIDESIFVRPKLYLKRTAILYKDGRVEIKDGIASKGIPKYSWKGNTEFFERVLASAQARGKEHVTEKLEFDTLKRSGFTSTGQPLSHTQHRQSRVVKDGWTGRVLDPETLIFYPIGWQADSV